MIFNWNPKAILNTAIASITVFTLPIIPLSIQAKPILSLSLTQDSAEIAMDVEEVRQHCQDHVQQMQESIGSIQQMITQMPMPMTSPLPGQQHHTEMMATIQESLAGMQEMHEHCKDHLSSMEKTFEQMQQLINQADNLTTLTPTQMQEHHKQMIETTETLMKELTQIQQMLNSPNHQHGH